MIEGFASYKLANDEDTYGEFAGNWIICTDDLEQEVTAPYPTEAEAWEDLAKQLRDRI